MEYMLLIYQDESRMSPEDQDMSPWMAYTAAVQEAGVYVTGAGLMPVSTATTVRVRDSETVMSDGPFAETKEQLGGYYLLKCDDLDQALHWAAKIPTVTRGSVEVRPLFNPGG